MDNKSKAAKSRHGSLPRVCKRLESNLQRRGCFFKTQMYNAAATADALGDLRTRRISPMLCFASCRPARDAPDVLAIAARCCSCWAARGTLRDLAGDIMMGKPAHRLMCASSRPVYQNQMSKRVGLGSFVMPNEISSAARRLLRMDQHPTSDEEPHTTPGVSDQLGTNSSLPLTICTRQVGRVRAL